MRICESSGGLEDKMRRSIERPEHSHMDPPIMSNPGYMRSEASDAASCDLNNNSTTLEPRQVTSSRSAKLVNTSKGVACSTWYSSFVMRPCSSECTNDWFEIFPSLNAGRLRAASPRKAAESNSLKVGAAAAAGLNLVVERFSSAVT
jgi:hypothetical protein